MKLIVCTLLQLAAIVAAVTGCSEAPVPVTPADTHPARPSATASETPAGRIPEIVRGSDPDTA